MSKTVHTGDTIHWKWGSGNASGTVEKASKRRTQIQSSGSTITRNGTEDDPAVVIKQEDGSKVLKLTSELS